MLPQARTPTTRFCTRNEIGPVVVSDEAADGIKEEGTEVMPSAISNPQETGGVEATRTDKGNPLRNASIVACSQPTVRLYRPDIVAPGP